MPQEKTPGVYIVEKNAFPNSVVEVATAVPAFIGYTEQARRGDTDLTNKPTRLSSLAEYELYFGGAPKTQFTIDADGKLELVKASRFLLYYGMRLFFDNGGGPCWVTSVGPYTNAEDPAKFIQKSANVLEGPLKELKKEQEPTMIVVPDAVLLGIDDWQSVSQQVLAHCVKLMSRIAILDVYDGHKPRTYDKADVVSGEDAGFRNKIEDDFPSYGMAYYPWLNTSIVEAGDLDFTCVESDSRENLAGFIKKGMEEKQQQALKKFLDTLGAQDAKAQEIKKAHEALLAASKPYSEKMAEIQRQLNMLPPSAGMAGVYTRVDNTQGVFKAPANTGIKSVVSPTVNISHEDQEDLNIPVDGKAINAIRTFLGKGVLIWGARTLDGNSQDWRYINVRRTLIMLEQSIKYAAEAYVFAPNNASTWVTVSNMIGNFLNNKWKEGALVGATPPEAYSVDVGLGSTMTGNDILDGYMRVTVKVAVVRPAEFIVITFQQKMQTS